MHTRLAVCSAKNVPAGPGNKRTPNERTKPSPKKPAKKAKAAPKKGR